MTEPMTPERLAEIEARANAATQGPWEAATGALVGDDYDEATHVWYRLHSPDRMWQTIGKVLDNELDQTTIEDAEFIAEARTDVPDLLAEVRRLQALAAALGVETGASDE